MFHVDSLNNVIYCANAWDCLAPGKHFSTKEDAEKSKKSR